ncbi:MAG: T9SS type A sorting domain-containing protein [Flavobacteriales bacterium]
MRHFLATSLFAACAATAAAQFPYSGSAFSHTYAPLAEYEILDVTPGWDDPTVPFALPFLFPIGGDVMNTLSISGLGIEVFAETESGLLHVIWPVTLDIMDVSAAGDVAAGDASTYRTAVSGTAPNRIFKLEYHNAGFYNEIEGVGTSTQRMNAQLWLHEATGVIEYHFGPNTVTDWTVLSDGLMSSALALDFDYYSYAGSILAASGPVAAPTWTAYDGIDAWFESMSFLSGMPENGTGYRFTPAGTTSISDAIASEIVLAPNPAREAVTLSNGVAASDLRIFDPTGRCVSTLVLQPGERRVLDVAGFAPGVYLVHSATTGTARRLVIE